MSTPPLLNPELDALLLSRIEDASLNASAPSQQRWIDGWLVRYSPGKAKRARSVQTVAAGRGPVADRLAACEALYREAGLPLFVRITPFALPEGLDATLADIGLARFDDTRVMVKTDLHPVATGDVPEGLRCEHVGPVAFAQAIGHLRGSPMAQREAQAERLAQSPVPFEGWVMSAPGGDIAACGQVALESALAGLYDVCTAPAERGRGRAGWLCRHLLVRASQRGATVAYLQVDSDNATARRLYQRLGFVDGYAYHYRGHADAA